MRPEVWLAKTIGHGIRFDASPAVIADRIIAAGWTPPAPEPTP